MSKTRSSDPRLARGAAVSAVLWVVLACLPLLPALLLLMVLPRADWQGHLGSSILDLDED
jgi:hypothetical protein